MDGNKQEILYKHQEQKQQHHHEPEQDQQKQDSEDKQLMKTIFKYDQQSEDSADGKLNAYCCDNCGLVIKDKYLLSALDKKWHIWCLKCSYCDILLDNNDHCYIYNGYIYCNHDYKQLFNRLYQCIRCNRSIKSTDLVIKLSLDYYHLNCFSCVICDCIFQKNDHFGLYNGQIYCKLHYRTVLANYFHQFYKHHLNYYHHHYHHYHNHRYEHHQSFNVNNNHDNKNSDENINNNKIFSRKYKKLSNSYGWDQLRCKRVRTTFKYRHLATLKQYFTINHNPDCSALKQLSINTGLSIRVLQVWFQNARAKWRRNLLNQSSLHPQIAEEGQPLYTLQDTNDADSIFCTVIKEEQFIYGIHQ